MKAAYWRFNASSLGDSAASPFALYDVPPLEAMLQSWQAGTKGEFLVAAKLVKAGGLNPDAANELVQEAAVMAAVGEHPHVVSLIGVVTVMEPKLLLVSFCEHGSLHHVLRRRAEGRLADDLPDAQYVIPSFRFRASVSQISLLLCVL